MAKTNWAILLVAFTSFPAAADTAEDLDSWFREGYAALYVEDSWEHADEFAQYFAPIIWDRSDDGLVESDVNGFVIDLLDGWRDDGWLGTDIAKLDTKLLNATTAVFDVKWMDRIADGSTAYECGWYLADKVEGKWLLSQWIATECAD